MEGNKRENLNVNGKNDIYNLWRMENDLYHNLEFETVLKTFGAYYNPEKYNKKEVVNTIFEELNEKITKERQIYTYHIQVFNVKKIINLIKIGDFEIIPKSTFIESFDSEEAILWRNQRTPEDISFWRVKITVAEKYRGLEITEEYLKLFINAIRVLYMATDFKNSIDFLNNNYQTMRENVIINQLGVVTSPSKRDRLFKQIDIDNKKINEFAVI